MGIEENELGKHPQKKKTWHRLNPRSRAPELIAKIKNPSHELIGKIYRKKLIDDRLQVAWHMMFSNMFAWEAIEQVKLWASKTLNNFKIALNSRQWYGWKTVFGTNATPKAAIEIIKREWWPEYPPLSDFFP